MTRRNDGNGSIGTATAQGIGSSWEEAGFGVVAVFLRLRLTYGISANLAHFHKAMYFVVAKQTGLMFVDWPGTRIISRAERLSSS